MTWKVYQFILLMMMRSISYKLSSDKNILMYQVKKKMKMI